jgi:hypothetical protein
VQAAAQDSLQQQQASLVSLNEQLGSHQRRLLSGLEMVGKVQAHLQQLLQRLQHQLLQEPQGESELALSE